MPEKSDLLKKPCTAARICGKSIHMANVLVMEPPRNIRFIEEPDQDVGPHDVRVATVYSGISAGTELTRYRGTNPKLIKYWDEQRGVFVPVDATSSESPLPDHATTELVGRGFEQVGRIVEIGVAVEDLVIGDLVYGVWGHRSHAVITAEAARLGKLPAEMDPMLGIFTRAGIVALNGILDGEVNIGETVAVFGMGVIGQIVAQLAGIAGADVIGCELISARRELARRLNPKMTIVESDAAASDVVRELTRGRGADVCFEVAGKTAALHEAIRACATSSRVVALGFYQGEATNLYLGEEFHHNRVTIVSSQIGGISPQLQHRWNRERLTRTFMQMVADGRIDLASLVTHVRPFEEASEVFRMVDENPAEVMEAVFTFPETAKL